MQNFPVLTLSAAAFGVAAIFSVQSLRSAEPPTPQVEVKVGTPANPPAASPPFADHTAVQVDLLNTPAVGKELNFTPDQQAQFRRMMQSMREDFQKIRAQGLNPPPASPDSPPQDIRVQAGMLYQKYQKQIQDILTPEQEQRLQQMSLRMRGLKSVLDDNVSQALRLSDEQTKSIQKLIDDAHEARRMARRAPRPAGRFGRQERRARVQNVNADLDAQIQRVLTPEQLAMFDKMLGGEFDFSSVKSEESQKLEDSIQLGEPEPTSADAKPATPDKK